MIEEGRRFPCSPRGLRLALPANFLPRPLCIRRSPRSWRHAGSLEKLIISSLRSLHLLVHLLLHLQEKIFQGLIILTADQFFHA